MELEFPTDAQEGSLLVAVTNVEGFPGTYRYDSRSRQGEFLLMTPHNEVALVHAFSQPGGACPICVTSYTPVRFELVREG